MPLNSFSCRADWAHNPVGVYLMSCYAYEVLAQPFISDRSFDELGAYLACFWDIIDHPHKGYIDPENCAHTSALTVGYAELPLIVLAATHQKVGSEFRASPVYGEAIHNSQLRMLI